MFPPKSTTPLYCVFLPAVKKILQNLNVTNYIYAFRFFGPTEVSLTEIACTQQDSPPQSGRL